eukprot:scaffold49260_cov63-Attheya_sp.AAC.1
MPRVSSKARGVAYCSEGAAPRVVYSKFGIDNTTKHGEPKDRKKPNKRDYDKMKCRIEGGGYMCVEPHYYSTNDTRGGRVLTKIVCAVCYESDGLVLKKEVLNSKSTGGRDVLPICHYCFEESGITVVASLAAAVNQKCKWKEEKKDKETRRNKAVAAGHRHLKTFNLAPGAFHTTTCSTLFFHLVKLGGSHHNAYY